MSELVSTVFILFCLLQIKHMFADYFLQTPRMLAGRATYWHLGRAQHALIHAIGSAAALLLIGAPIGFILTICAAEWVVHFHIDWAKAHHSETCGYCPNDAGFWRAAGIDQALHQFTYIALVWAWVRFSTHLA
ncbi:DUF3307 domain-containing protein [Sedimentitalea nanhaiensis]|uniref:DUF3307 domain-containing protein n=1 Tax=Sedimentitalea nanhaiensis TaxID=999627 RepID=A0A1I6X8E8_9RHOB|nr:DUF3307 domain-containing protein [Sedimentitalea nanhaiensis]SFT34433.1 Protein of unknown function [Sedimentitalea nanhaiensis]